jgi:hypothetical protein
VQAITPTGLDTEDQLRLTVALALTRSELEESVGDFDGQALNFDIVANVMPERPHSCA